MSTKTILIVDDSASLREVVAIALRQAGYGVILASHGQEALNLLKGQKINLVISDVNMPVMDGLTFVKQLKERTEYKFTPILMLTTESQPEKMQQGKASGVKAWIVKPFRAPALIEAVQKLVLP